MSRGKFYSGTSGLVLPVKNKGEFPAEYKDKSRLTYYSSLFNSVEINSSFYKVPQAKTVKKWIDEVEGSFLFTYKLWRNITHNKGLQFDPANVSKFMQVVNEAGDNKGCLLIQFPASTKADNRYQLDYLISEIQNRNKDKRWKIAVEFRDRSWYNTEVYSLLDKYSASVVIHDMPKSATPMNIKTKADFVYLRYHGPGGRYRGSYDDDLLHDHAQLISEWLGEGKEVFAYFNNTMGDAVKNLMTLNKFVANIS